MAIQDTHHGARGSAVSTRLEYNLLFAACLSVALPAVAAQRVIRLVRGRPINPLAMSIFAEARSTASAATGYAFSA